MEKSKDFIGEVWKVIKFEDGYIKSNRLEVSNFGRVRSFNLFSNGKLLAGSFINGYKIIRLKLFKPRSAEMTTHLAYLKSQVLMLQAKLKNLKLEGVKSKQLAETESLLKSMKAKLSAKYKADTKTRTVYYHALIHRLVATYFLKAPKSKQTLVAHLDFDKLNNKVNNLKWMTPEENQAHQENSPFVIAEKEIRKSGLRKPTNAKLTVTRVMLLKKLLNNGKSIKALVKQFKVTDTQILRIKRGENWGNVDPAS